MARRFPAPWTVHHNESSYWVEDARGKKFAFTYYRAQLMDGQVWVYEDEARRIATSIAKLPGLLKGG